MTYEQSASGEITEVKERKTGNFNHSLQGANNAEHSVAPTQLDYKCDNPSSQGQKPLTAAILNIAPLLKQKRMLGKQMYPLIKCMIPELG